MACTWDSAKDIQFFLIRDADNPAAVGTFPGPIVRVPRGVIYHAHTHGHGPPPHTIHWHGLEPTPINDGVGHCSMEIGDYTYQWQPNFIGHYFYHCHRNTVQHFEFGLYSVLFVEPPDAYFATQELGVPIGHCRDGKRRIATNLDRIKDQNGDPVANPFPGFNNNPITTPDPEAANPALPDSLKFLTDPHAMTVPYDVEVFWNPDERDSVWSELAPGARDTYPQHGDIPGFNDNFAGNAGGGLNPDDFFAFNDFRPDYFYVTGVPVPAHRADLGGTGVGTIPTGVTIPPELNSGVAGTQVSVQASLGQTILFRALDAAYVCVEYTFPIDVVVIAWDGRSLGVPPYGEYNHPYLVPAGTPIHASVARRFDALAKSDVPIDDFATIKFIDTRGQLPGEPPVVLMTAKIPFNIGTQPQVATFGISGTITDETSGATLQGVAVTVAPRSLGGSAIRTVVTNVAGNYSVTGLTNGMYAVIPELDGFEFTPLLIDTTINGADVTGQDFVGINVADVITILAATVNARGAAALTRGPLWNIRGTGTPETTVSIFFGNDLRGEFIGAATVRRGGRWKFTRRVPIITPLIGAVSISLSSSAGGELLDYQLTSVRTARVNTRGPLAALIGPLWNLQGTGSPGTTLSIFLGPDLTGELIGIPTVDAGGKWKLVGRIPVTLPITATSISISTSAGGELLDQPLTVR